MRKSLLLAFVLCVLAPAQAWAGDVRMVARDLPVRPAARSLQSAAPRFDMVGLHWRGSGDVSFRTRSPSGRWSAWRPAAPEAEDLPDVESKENRLRGWRIGNPWWTGASDRIEVRRRGRVTHVRAFFLSSPVEMIPLRKLQFAGSPQIVTRRAWQADESIRRKAPKYADAIRFAIVHHTAGTAGSNPAQAAAIVRGIEVYHVKGNGWDDIGYNFLVDRFGDVYEGRFGGVDKNVIGAHALGFNTGSVGVAMIGTYAAAAPSSAAMSALDKLLAWRLDIAHVDPLAPVTVTSGGNAKYAMGTSVALRGVVGHRDTGPTTCPGSALYALLPTIRQQVAATGAPKLYAPAATGTLGGPIRFTARLTQALPWTVTVRDATGKTLGAGSGTSALVDWTWDSRGASTRASYPWTIAAGADVRSASGVLGAKQSTLTLKDLIATPARIDGTTATSATISYTLSAAANVTGELLNSAATPIATLFSEDKLAGAQSFLFSAEGVPDGNYTIRLTARDMSGRVASASVAVLVSRTLLGFSADSPVVSPNGDGRRDSVTFRISLAASADVTLSLDAKKTSAVIFAGTLQPGDRELPWTGIAADGSSAPDGTYRATLTIGAPPLAYSLSLPMAVDTRAPGLALVSLSPLRLRVDERSAISGKVNGIRIATSAKPGVFRLAWRGTVRTLRVVARDAAGNESQPVTWPSR